ncbi:helix-turn-helix domain-containing protein [Streptomyces griseus]|uniref:helix-turn-helix domain-containing protein n=1 Tax=Streptomyces TaxID=1883 RepID=UPI0029C402EE|nr:helix-turn-helix domain-containing protein [Streptomyces sp. ID01-9D]MDX5576077.1 helix-turn-helix domain-containing protein [Streptomyces sp. ID01-9D]WTC85331.1 helix-turn-helix domain-containing protein [Streptomyces griseus]WTD72051.1 helix-turn-helix domain-containing protein [Streptomyces griseus]
MGNDERELYSVGEVAELLGLHVRTVRNYVREGRLKAVRIGKQYRISKEDFAALTGRPVDGTAGHPADGTVPVPVPAPAPALGHVEVSSIVQIDALGPDAAHRLSTFVTASTQSARDTVDPLRVQTVYDKERTRMKIVILGGAAATADLLHMIDGLLGPDNDLLASTDTSTGGQGADRA